MKRANRPPCRLAWVTGDFRKSALSHLAARGFQVSEENIRRVVISGGGPLRAILEVEDDTRVVAVLRPNGSIMEYRDIPQWVFQEIRNRGMVYIGNAFVEPEAPRSPFPQPPLSRPDDDWRNIKSGVLIVFAALGGLFIFAVIAALISNDGDSTIPVAESPTRTPRVFNTPTPRPTPTPIAYVSVSEILDTFQANPARGKLEYMEEPIYVIGRVRGFNDSDSRVVYLTPDTTWETDDYEVFLIRLPSLAQAAALSIGDTIRTKCKIGSGYAFPHGYEIECSPIGSVLLPPTPTPRPTPTPTATATLLPPATATAQAMVDTATATARPTSTPIFTAAPTLNPTPTFDERKQIVIDKHCSGVQACIDLMQTEYCVEFYENPPQYYTRYGTCTAWALGG